MTTLALDSRSIAHSVPSIGKGAWNLTPDNPALGVTLCTVAGRFENAEHLLSDLPIREPKRTLDECDDEEDRIDSEIAARRLKEIADNPAVLMSEDELKDSLAKLRR